MYLNGDCVYGCTGDGLVTEGAGAGGAEQKWISSGGIVYCSGVVVGYCRWPLKSVTGSVFGQDDELALTFSVVAGGSGAVVSVVGAVVITMSSPTERPRNRRILACIT